MPDGKPANHFAFDGQCKDKVIGKIMVMGGADDTTCVFSI
jgi:hypothetical protein